MQSPDPNDPRLTGRVWVIYHDDVGFFPWTVASTKAEAWSRMMLPPGIQITTLWKSGYYAKPVVLTDDDTRKVNRHDDDGCEQDDDDSFRVATCPSCEGRGYRPADAT